MQLSHNPIYYAYFTLKIASPLFISIQLVNMWIYRMFHTRNWLCTVEGYKVYQH